MSFGRNILTTLFVLLFLPAAAHATIINLSASMDCAQANAGAGTCAAGGSGVGQATITFDDVTNQLSWQIIYGGLSSPESAMHFHGPASPGNNAGVQVNVGVGAPVVGATVLTGPQATELLNDLWYLNLHTDAFPSGEIRGQVRVPEPTTLALLGPALLGAVVVGRRRPQALRRSGGA